jgi:hypothetical protein
MAYNLQIKTGRKALSNAAFLKYGFLKPKKRGWKGSNGFQGFLIRKGA